MLKPEKPVGILCHGQLAMMTGEAAKMIGIAAIALGPGENSPASHVMPVDNGNFNDPETVKNFVAAHNIGSLVLDTDHVSAAVFKELQAMGISIIPGGLDQEHTSVIQHRRAQKERLQQAGLPIAPWHPALSKQELFAAFKHLGEGVIIKTAEGGFDGRGNMHVDSLESLDNAWTVLGGRELVVEKRLPLARELAMMLAQDVRGNRALYPLVESVHQNGMLEYIFYPARVDKQVEQTVQGLGNDILAAFPGPGLIGMELMQTMDGQIVVNEVAGRPHNTGHFTIEACVTSQFTNLMRIATGQEVGPADLLNPDQLVLMHNLNGGTLEGVNDQKYNVVRQLGGELHWYHKSARPQRKRGHLTLFGTSRESLMRNADDAMKAINFFS